MLRTSIDLGTNTCLLLVAECDPSSGRVQKIISDHSTIVRLGEGVDRNRKFLPEAMERALGCLKEYAKVVRQAGAKTEQTLAVATSQARDSSNVQEFFDRVRAETGFGFQKLTGQQEAEATFLGGILPGMDQSQSVVIDIGGGSTELTAKVGSELIGQSLDMGSVRFTERYLKSDPVTDTEFWACQAAIDQQIERWSSEWGPRVRVAALAPRQLVAVAGTATTLGSLYLELQAFDRDQLDSVTLTRGDVHRIVEELKWRTVDERKAMPGMEPKRADVMLAGSMILWRTMERLDFGTCRVSTRGLRFGVLNLH